MMPGEQGVPKWTRKLLYCVRDVGNATVSSAILFAVALPLLIWDPITRASRAGMRERGAALESSAGPSATP